MGLELQAVSAGVTKHLVIIFRTTCNKTSSINIQHIDALPFSQ